MPGPKKYELAYVLPPSLSEEEVLAWKEKIISFVQETGGIIRYSESPKKRLLAYPIKKERTGYFGWTTFSMPVERISMLEKKIKGMDILFRHLITEEQEIPPQPLRMFSRPQPIKVKQPLITIPDQKTTKVDDKLDLEELDKKLEEILGK